jgi:hypothetical protein
MHVHSRWVGSGHSCCIDAVAQQLLDVSDQDPVAWAWVCRPWSRSQGLHCCCCTAAATAAATAAIRPIAMPLSLIPDPCPIPHPHLPHCTALPQLLPPL